jgi:hypothetical protein
MVGTVKVRRGGSATWIDARPSMPLRQKDAVRTFVESKATIRTSEGSVIDIGENSTVEMSVFNQNEDGSRTTNVRIFNGRVMSDVKKLVTRGSKFEFETPTATAAIRGTRVGFDVTGDKTDIRVYEGRVFVQPSGGGTGAELGSNQMTTVSRGQKEIEIAKLVEKAPGDSTARDSVLTDSTHADSVLADSTLADSASIDSVALDTVSGSDTTTADSTLEDTLGYDTSAPDTTSHAMSDTASSAPALSQQVSEPAEGGDIHLVLSAPAEGQRIDRPLIRVSGNVTPGASLEMAGMAIPVGANGEFMKDIPIPDEEGSMTVEFEATLGDKSVVRSRTIDYRRPDEPLSIDIQMPTRKQMVCRTTVLVRGSVRPADAELTVNGTVVVVRNGIFNAQIAIPADQGEHELVFEAAARDKTLSETRLVRFEPADKQCNTDPPSLRGELPTRASQPTLWFTVYDKTMGDEITFYREIDGSGDSETGEPNSRFALELEEGEHGYAVWAEDAAGNRTAVRKATVRYLPASVPVTVRRRRPASSRVTLGIPPGRPSGDDEEPFEPMYSVEFSVDNLPDDDPTFLKAVTISNDRTGWSDMAGLVDTDFEFDVPLKQGGNHVVIEVRDINDRIVRDEFDIIVR